MSSGLDRSYRDLPKGGLSQALELPDWFEDAECREADPEAFFPQVGQQAEPAIAICRRCPIREDCLTWAIENDQNQGVWGGVSERQRWRLRSQMMRRAG